MKAENPTCEPRTSEELIQELHAIVAQAEKVFGATLAECAHEKGPRLRERLAKAQSQLAELYAEADGKILPPRRGEPGGRQPRYEPLALALGVGALLGLVHSRKADGSKPSD
jgi:hypothetical protein